MGSISLECPHCGAVIQFENDRKNGFCSYCGGKIDNDCIKTAKSSRNARFMTALTGALDALATNDRNTGKILVDEAMKLNGKCSDILYLKSIVMLYSDYDAAQSYYLLADENPISVGVVTGETYGKLLRIHARRLREETCKFIRDATSVKNCSAKDMENCRNFVTNIYYGVIDHKFDYFGEVIRNEAKDEFPKMEGLLGIPNRVSQEHWDALVKFDEEYLVAATALAFADESLKIRYKTLIDSYDKRLDNKWISLFKKRCVSVDRKGLAGMKDRAKLFSKLVR